MSLALVGSEEELLSLRNQVLAVAAGEKGEIVVELDSEGEPKYSRLLRTLRVQVDEGATQVNVLGGVEMQVFGSPENLKKFSSFLVVPPGLHIHYEYFDGNPAIRSSSVPLVVQCEP